MSREILTENEAKLQQGRLNHCADDFLKSPLTQIASMQTRVKQLAVCLYTRGVTQLSERCVYLQQYGDLLQTSDASRSKNCRDMRRIN